MADEPKKQLPDGRWIAHDGQGWYVTEGPQDAQPPQAPAQSAPPSHQDGPGMTTTLATKFGAPMLGGLVGGAVGGPPGFVLGTTAGKAYGDLANWWAGGQVPESSTDETVDLGKTALGAALFGNPVTQRVLRAVPGPVSLKNGAFGALAGGEIGREMGHPYLGASVGAGVGAFNMLGGLMRGAGRLSEGLTTRRFGPFAGSNEIVPTPPEGNVPLPTTNRPGQMTQEELGAVIRQRSAQPGAAPPPQRPSIGQEFMNGVRQGATPPQPPDPALIAPEPYGPRNRVSREIPFRIPEDQLPDYRSVDPNRTFSRPTLPDLSQDADTRWNAAVETPPGVQYHPAPEPPAYPNLIQEDPSEAGWPDLAQLLKPRRASPKAFNGVEVNGQTFDRNAPVTRPDPSKPNGGPKSRPNEVRGTVGGQEPGPATSEDRGLRPQRTPRTVDDAEGLTLKEQMAWDRYKRANPGVSDNLINSWYSTYGGKEEPAQRPVESMVNELMRMFKGKR